MTQLSFWGYDDTGIAKPKGRRIIYFVESGDYIKIGFTSRDIAARIGELGTGNPSPIKLIGTLLVSAAHDDRDLHRRFAQFHYRNEWFHKNDDLLALLHGLITNHEIEVDWYPVDPSLPLYIRHPCPICRQPDPRPPSFRVRSLVLFTSLYRNSECRTMPVETIGENRPGHLMGAAICDNCDTPFVLRVKPGK